MNKAYVIDMIPTGSEGTRPSSLPERDACPNIGVVASRSLSAMDHSINTSPVPVINMDHWFTAHLFSSFRSADQELWLTAPCPHSTTIAFVD